MKKFVNTITMVCLCTLVMGVSNSHAQEAKDHKVYLSFGGSYLNLSAAPSDDKNSSYDDENSSSSFGGGNITIGFMPGGNNLLSFEFGGGGGESQKIGSFEYYVITRNSSGQETNRELKTDGKISYGYSLYEAVFAYNRVFNLSDKWRFRVGPGVGMLTISGSDSYSPSEVGGKKIEGLPDSQSESKKSLLIGVIAGCTWNFTERLFLDMNYRLSFNNELEFPDSTRTLFGHKVKVAEAKKFGSIGNRINVGLGFRF